MNTPELLQAFLKDAEERGITPRTRQTYWYRLRHFAEAFPELPTSPKVIETFLAARGETPSKRAGVYKSLQAFYSHLEKMHGIKSPVPSRGPVGRPRATRYPAKNGPGLASLSTPSTPDKLVQGGSFASNSTYTSTAPLKIKTRDAVDAFLVRSRNKNLRPTTIALQTQYLNRFADAFSELPLTAEPISSWLGGLTSVSRHKRGKSAFGQPLDQESKWSYQKQLVALYHFLKRRYPIDYPVWPEERISLPTKIRPVLTPQELQKVMKSCDDKMDRAAVLTLMDSKMRVGELVSIDREGVYPDYVLVAGKEGPRIVPVKPDTSEVLCRLSKKGPLFKCEGRRMKARTMAKRISRLMVESGLKGAKLGPHILRHSMANLHVENDGDLLTLKEELGHTTLRMTERYAKQNPVQVRRKHQQYDILGKVLGQPAPGVPPAPALQGESATVGSPEVARPAGSNPPLQPSPRPPRPPATDAAQERKRGLSGWGDLLILGPGKKPASAPAQAEPTGQLALGI